jgi:hypothetical protein
VALEIIKGRKIKRKELMTGKNKINKAILILKSIGLIDEIRQRWKDIFHIWRVHFK